MNKLVSKVILGRFLFTIAIVALGNVRGAKARPFFVFGSSYVDTGNIKSSDSTRPYPWAKPYGETWPGTPSGRYSNGHVLTDVLAVALNLSSPISFAQRVPGIKNDAGMNFGIGGSGVLTAYGYPSTSAQIYSLRSLISDYTKDELASAVVLYATAGDDYLYYLTVQNSPVSGLPASRNGNLHNLHLDVELLRMALPRNATLEDIKGIYALSLSVGKQISSDLVTLYGMGLRKFAVTYLPPMGCLPVSTVANSFQSCNDSWNTNIAQVHNARVWKNALGLRHYFTNATIVLLDLYSAFTSAIATFGSEQSLKPCCAGITPKNKCSNVDAIGHPLYSLCADPGSKFYWDDMVHPTETGWQAVVSSLQSSLSQLK
eukprot:c9366_g1_i2 orf=272-1390(-)